MAAKAKTTSTTDDKIISLYMDYVLDLEIEPKSIYKFCKDIDITEADFYKHFGSFEVLKKKIWEKFFDHTINLLQKNKAYETYGNKEKVLALFYTLFETMLLNRSYILFALHGSSSKLENLKQLSLLREKVLDYGKELIEDRNDDLKAKVAMRSPKIFSNGLWVQFMFLLKFWLDDDSPSFEKTDVAIEKSVTTIFDVFDNTPLESVIDFGKFLYQEKFT